MKKIILLFIGIIVIILLVSFNNYTRKYFNNNDKIITNLNILKQKELALNNETFMFSVSLYKNFDSIVFLEKEIDIILNELTKDKEFQNKKKAYKIFLEYKQKIKEKIEKIYKLESIIAPLKNSEMYIAELIRKLPFENLNTKDRVILLNITSNIFLAKSSLDKQFITNLSENLKQIEQSNNSYKSIFINNAHLINKLFPVYINKIDKILNSKTEILLKKSLEKFLIETNQKLTIITIVSIALILFVILSILLILYLFMLVEKENKILEKMSITDELTKLYNRRKLQIDIKENSTLFVININRFKYYNDLYGIKVGDFILQNFAKNLKSNFSKLSYNFKFYRISSDEFGVLLDKKLDDNILKQISKELVEYFKNNPIKYKDVEFHIMLTIGISYIKPLLETADIVLKSIKKDKKTTIAIYNPNLKEKQKLEDNMQKLSILKKAIKKDNIIPFYQPIYSNGTGEIIKYEVLARIKDNDKIMSIYPFLNIAKENKLYRYITQSIYQKAIKEFQNKNIEFSLNISIDDINNEYTMNFIYNLIKNNSNILSYITFEILEDDAINDYSALKEFIILVKKYGAKIAIDDFGSGYSNFAHILNLDIDYLKIDGSLIKNIDTDNKMQLIVETIVDFSNKTNILTIAEFVHKKEVLEKVKNLNIDYSQGFYLAEPKPDLVK